VGAALCLGMAACADPCVNAERSRATSPDGRTDAVVFSRGCGATTAGSIQVAIVERGARATGIGNAFVSEDDLPVDVAWSGPRALTVRHRADVRVVAARGRVGHVLVVFQEQP
jgi:hypothetical protein